jgi:hypothetical protein
MRSRDPLDSGHGPTKKWEEFRASFSAALLQAWLLFELDEIAPNYFSELESRFTLGFANADGLAELEDDYDGAVPLEGADGVSVWFINAKEAGAWYDQLFPHGRVNASEKTSAYGLSVVGLHSAFESYFDAIVVDRHERRLPKAVQAYFGDKGIPLEAACADVLTEFDATRNIVVHNRGVIDNNYINSVKYNQFVPGERRPIAFDTLRNYSKVLWELALKMKLLNDD